MDDPISQPTDSLAKIQTFNAQQSLEALEKTLTTLRANKPNNRSEQDRYWAIVITDVEKALAVFKAYVVK